MEAGTGPQEGLTSYLGLSICAVTEQLWCLERQELQACLSSSSFLRGGGQGGWETAFICFTFASQKFRKTTLVFSDPGKEFLHFDHGHKNTELM